MKKIIAMFLALSFLLCVNAAAYAAEGNDSGSELLTVVENTSMNTVESANEEDVVPTEEPVEIETTEPTEESTAPGDTAPIGDSEVTQESPETVPDDDSLPEDDENLIGIDDAVIDNSMAVDEVYNIKIEWKGLVFTYHEATKGRWEPNKDKGGPAWVDPQPAHWTSSDVDNNDCGTLAITNNVSELETVKASIKFTPDTQWGTYKVGLAISENEGDVTTDKPDSESLYWTASQAKVVQIPKGETKNIYVRPGVSTDTLSNNTFKGMSESSPVLFGNITISISPDFNDPSSPEQPGIE